MTAHLYRMILAGFLVREKQRLTLLRALAQDASVDPLTHLLNRRGFDHSAAVIERRWRDAGEGFSVVMFDVDHFKRINDTLGHQAGDRILKRIAHIVRTSMRKTDLIARYGGEEIVALMPNTARDVAVGMAERVRSRVERELAALNVLGFPITISAGAATSSRASQTLETVMRQADRSLYQAKNSGRNRVKANPRRRTFPLPREWVPTCNFTPLQKDIDGPSSMPCRLACRASKLGFPQDVPRNHSKRPA